jgi:cystathionine gamma-synthase
MAVADTRRWIEMCGVADLIWLASPSNPLLTVGELDRGGKSAQDAQLSRAADVNVTTAPYYGPLP